MKNKKGIETFVENLNTEDKIKFDKLVIEYSKAYGNENMEIIKTLAYNEIMRK